MLATEVNLTLCHYQNGHYKCFKDPLSGLTQFLTIESPLKMMKNASHFMLKALFVLEMFKFMS